MSKKTNAFQRAVFHIYDELKSDNTLVTESEYLKEKLLKLNKNREIDILIESKKDNGSNNIKTAIECRSHKKKCNINWIDQIVGKYIKLGADNVIAISESGFTKDALNKAKVHNIQCITPKDVSKIDWQKGFIKIGIGDVMVNFKIADLKFIDSNKVEYSIGKIKKVESASSSFDDQKFIHSLESQIFNDVRFRGDLMKDYFEKHNSFSAIAGMYQTTREIELNSFKITNDEGVVLNVNGAFLTIEIYPSAHALNVKHSKIGKSIISQTTFEPKEGHSGSKMIVVQPSTDKTTHKIVIEKKEKKG